MGVNKGMGGAYVVVEAVVVEEDVMVLWRGLVRV